MIEHSGVCLCECVCLCVVCVWMLYLKEKYSVSDTV